MDLVILVDDGSKDRTKEIPKELDLELFVHHRNYSYGLIRRFVIAKKLKVSADIVVMVHPDYQYNPALLLELIEPIKAGKADVVLGSRLFGGRPMEQGMQCWKFAGNRFLTPLQNRISGLKRTHTGGAILERTTHADHGVQLLL